MASRLKEEEKNERIIRNLLKLPDNRRCINCNSLGPQYVCTNFWTFVCTNCSGIHREFTHRVKSVSMAKFTSQEVSALQGGGNAKAKEIYLKEWDSQKNSLPEASNVQRLRDFIKHVYVDRRYSGEKSVDKPPRGKMGETEDIHESKRLDTYQGGSRSPPFEDRFERRYSDRTSQGGRSPGYEQEKWQQGDTKKSPARTEVLNDWRREDRFGTEKKYDEGRASDVSLKSGDRSPDHQRDPALSIPPVVRPMREILGDNATSLRVIEPPKENRSRSLDGSTLTQRTTSSSSLASSNGNSNELRRETSLIDFDDVAEIPANAPAPQVQQQMTSVPASQVATPLAADNWANFGAVSDVKTSQAPSTASPLDFILSELAAPATAAVVGVSAPMVINSTGITHGWNLQDANPAPVSVLPVNRGFVNTTNAGQWINMQQTQPHSASTGIGGPTPPQSFTPMFGVPTSNQQLDAQESQPVSVAQSTSQAASNPSLTTTSESVGRRELPEGLFASAFPSWQTGTPYVAGFNMRYNMQMHVPTFQQPSNSSNPFDVGGEQPSVQFPSMSSIQGALPNMVAPTGLLQTSSFGTPASTWIPQQPSHSPAMPVLAPSHPAVPGSYMGQQAPSAMPSRPPRTAGLGLEGSAYGGVNPNQHLVGLYAAPTNQNTFSSVGGNPFG
ncbi:hypothetical protein Leryth_012558 [Lithospermum erythrorhizon]|nr:hypothetical protein Leryth_012558 [Lithospermum erythrorhizon]